MTFILLCVANIGFAQLEVSSVGNASIGNVSPLSDAKLYLYSSTPSTPTYGLRSILEHTNTVINGILPHPTLYGAFFENRQSGAYSSSYGVYVRNKNITSSGSTYGVYAKNEADFSSGSGSSYGFYADNSGAGVLYGAYISAKSTSGNPNSGAYGLYVTVSGVNTPYAGYFTGGKVVVMNGNVGIGKVSPAYELDVNGTIRASVPLVISDERLKSNIKSLSDEKERLYLLNGKSYMKKLLPASLAEDSLAEKKEEVIEFPEYGYLAQELEKIFPDLVSRDSAGYYAVNYTGLIPVIVEALKDQRISVEDKQAQIEKLQSQVDEQREQIKQLVKLMNIKSINEKVFEENGIESIPILLQNTPNPFNQATEIGYYIPENVNSANIYIYDVSGFQQKNISISERGKGATTLQASALQAGIYFYTLICDGKPVDTKQMILTK